MAFVSRSGDQCIPKSFHCDMETDCQDQSDEIGCSESYFNRLLNCTIYHVSQKAPPIIVESPPPKVVVDVSYTFVINCTAMGIPTPEIVWRLNWGHVPDKCTQTSTPQVER